MDNLQQHLDLVTKYIHEKKGIWITPIAPQGPRQEMLLGAMSEVAKEYFDNKDKTTKS